MEIHNIVIQRRQYLARELELINSEALCKLIEEREALTKRFTALDAEIERLCPELANASPDKQKESRKDNGAKKSYMSGAKIKEKVLEALQNNPTGISQSELSKISGVNYSSTVKFLKDNESLFTSTGTRKTKRITLKS